MKRRVLWLVLGVLVLAGIAYGFLADSVKTVETTVVETDDVSSSISISGKVVADREISVMPRVAGQVLAVLMKENDTVSKDQPLVRLDDRAATAQLDEAKAALSKAESELVVAQRETARLERLLRVGGASRMQVENQRSKLDMAKSSLASAKAAMESARLQKDYTVIAAPFDATIIDVSAKPGISVTTATELLKLAGTGKREVELAVDAGDIADIHPQQVVELTTDAMPDEQWQAVVLRIAPAVDSSKQGNTVDVRTSLPEDAPLKLGQQVDARVITAKKSSVPVLPFGTIKQRDDTQQVAVVSDGVVQWRKIETGIEGLSKVEVVNGVAAGDTVVTDPPDDLQDGEKVKTDTKP